MNETTLTYQEMTLSSRELIVPSSSYQRPFRPEHAMAITNKFVSIYHEEYDRRRLVRRLSGYDPLTIYREGQAMGVNMPGHKKYLLHRF